MPCKAKPHIIDPQVILLFPALVHWPMFMAFLLTDPGIISHRCLLNTALLAVTLMSRHWQARSALKAGPVYSGQVRDELGDALSILQKALGSLSTSINVLC